MSALMPMPEPPVQLQTRRQKSTPHVVTLAEQPGVRPNVPMSELVLVDLHEAQGWRVRQDERLDRLFEARCDWVRTYGRASRLAVDSAELSLTYDELDARANQLARYLRLHGADAGDRIALLFDRPADSYIAILAVLKIGATYVPLDVSHPAHLMASIIEDAQVRTVLSTSGVADAVEQVELLTAGGAEVVHLDRAAALISEQRPGRLLDVERGKSANELAYITYRTGADGRPTGVAVDHRSVCNFVKVAAETYGIRPSDRVYQGLSIAFDFSVEEIWVPLATGATLVPRPAGVSLSGQDLHAFLRTHRVTALYSMPSMLATLEEDLPDLRFLLVAGEACPQEQIKRWHKPGRRFLSVYGPAEATVSATWTELHPDKPTTLGIPLPTYSTVVLDVDDPFHALPHGEVGEIGIAGIGLACGYLNRDDLTEKAFIPDFLGIPANPSGRIYRTGDLGRVNRDGEIEYLGRIDGGRIDGDGAARRYRAEIDEIESALLRASQAPAPQAVDLPRPQAIDLPRPQAIDLPRPQAIDLPRPQAIDLPRPQAIDLPRPQAIDLPTPQAIDLPTPQAIDLPTPHAVEPLPAVDLVTPPGSPAGSAATTDTERELAALLAEVVGVDRVEVDANFFDDLGADSMVLARFCARLRRREDLPSISMRDVYQHPTLRSLATAFAPAPAAVPLPARSETVRALTEVLAEVVGSDQVTADSNFFDDLGADSMVMARFCARLRSREDLPSISMKDVYRNPTIRELAAGIPDAAPAPNAPNAPEPAPVPVHRASTLQYFVSGLLQFLLFAGYAYLSAMIYVQGYQWITAGVDLLDLYLRSVAFCTIAFVVLCTVPILAKWILIGRWKRRQIPIWSIAYVRFWFVKRLVQSNPLVLFVGTPLYSLYLRALGAKVGKGVLIFSKHLPVCTDLVTIGDGTVVRKDSYLTSYRAQAGLIHTGRISLGKDVLVGEMSVLDVDTSMGDGAQLGHVSSLHAGQAVPAGACWHGSPAQPADVSYRFAEPLPCGVLRRIAYPAVKLLALLAVSMPLAFLGVDLLLTMPQVETVLGPAGMDIHTWKFWAEVLAFSAALLLGSIVLGVLFMSTVPRLLNLGLKPDTTYPLYGIRYSLHQTVARWTNSKFLTNLFGDSSYIVPFLRGIGYRLTPLVQTGTNFGTEVKHDSPYLSEVGTGTVCASELSIINADYSSTSFRLSRTRIGANSFLGNLVTYPPQSKVGDNCLLATKVMVPIDGEVREGVGLLGSPSFEIPRTVERDNQFNHLLHGEEQRRRLAAKNRHNAVSIGLLLLARWILLVGLTVIGYFTVDLYPRFGAAAVAGAAVLSLLFSVLHAVVVERASTGFRGMPPKYCSIYQKGFWHTERFYKLNAPPWVHTMFAGTPLKGVMWRLVGVRVGKRLFDDGASMAEKNLVTLGDDVTINAGAFLQCHSQEDNVFKCDRISIGSGCSIGTNVMMLYSTTMGDGSALAVDSFLMKGEELPPNAHWGGNPAREMMDPLRVVELPALNAAAPVLVPQPASAELASSPEPLTAAAPVPAQMRWFGYGDLPLLEAGLRPGSHGEAVLTVQQQLQRLGFYTTAQLDGPTEAALRQFQEAAHVTGDPAGTVGRTTAVALLAAGERPVLRRGDSGEDVRRLQHALAVALGRPLLPTGDFLSLTEDAVRDYQASRGLPADGIATEATWIELQQGR